MAVARRKAVAVIDLDHVAVAAAPARGFHGAVGGDAHRIAGLAAEVEAAVHRRPAEERIRPHAEAGRQIDLAHDRLSHRHCGHGARQPLDVGARDLHTIELALERG